MKKRRRGIIKPMITLGSAFLLAIKPARKGRVSLNSFQRTDYAHRGLHNGKAGIPENTLPAFEKAIEKGYGIELDVQMTKDEKLVVFHDSNLKRACGLGIEVGRASCRELLKYGLFGTEERIPLLTEALAKINGRVPLIVEIKTDADPTSGRYKKICEKVTAVLEDYRGVYCVESFDPRVLLWLRKNKPHIVRGQLAEYFNRHGTRTSRVYEFLSRNLMFNFLTKPDFVAYQYMDRNCLALRLAKRIYGLQEVAWTVRDPKYGSFLKKTGCLVIFEGYGE